MGQGSARPVTSKQSHDGQSQSLQLRWGCSSMQGQGISWDDVDVEMVKVPWLHFWGSFSISDTDLEIEPMMETS